MNKFFARFLVCFSVWGIITLLATCAYSNDQRVSWVVAFWHTAPWVAIVILLFVGIFVGIDNWDA